MRRLGSLLIISIFYLSLNAQPWNYDFGTNTGVFNSGESTSFLPAPELNGGAERVRIGSAGGSFNMENQTISFGSSSYLRAEAATSTSYNKFTMENYTAGKTFTIKFNLRLGASDGTSSGANDGTWYFFIGDGSRFENNSTYSSSEVFTGLRWDFASSGVISFEYNGNGSWKSTGISGTPFSQGITYSVEIYGNNTTTSSSYTYGSSQSVAANTFDLWVDGSLVGDDLEKTGLPDDSNIDSWMFYGGGSTSNAANIFLDDFIYSNSISANPLPVQLIKFFAIQSNKSVQLTWQTSTEVNNFGFNVESKVENGEWKTKGFVQGSGTTNSPKEYSFVDENLPSVNTVSYRLKQIDIDGRYNYSKVVEVELSEITGVDENIEYTFALNQNYPNPFNPTTTISFTLPDVGGAQNQAKLNVYNLLGQKVRTLVNEVKPAGQYEVQFNASYLPSGIYFYKLSYGEFTQTRKLMLMK